MACQHDDRLRVQDAYLDAIPAGARAATVQFARFSSVFCLTAFEREDVIQESLLSLWSSFPAHKSTRSSIRTFIERIVTNKVVSLVREVRADRRRHGKACSIDSAKGLASQLRHCPELRIAINEVLSGVDAFDRAVALSLVNFSVVETSKRLAVPRGRVNRSIGRLRSAFAAAGFSQELWNYNRGPGGVA
jgi:DNA-directed RNA polymerase specialized sigma24 family protein